MWPFRRRHAAVPVDAASVGRRGETLARKHLRRRGWTILARNYRCPAGEIDLIALDRSDGAVVFVEVKARTDDSHVAPYSAVNAEKQRRIRSAAKYYLARRDTGTLTARFDVVSIVFRPNAEPALDHLVDAFR
jgi:putative endonuclease